MTNTDSISGAMLLLRSACCSSYSKSVMARSPFTTPPAPTSLQKLTSRPENGRTSTPSARPSSASAASSMSTRSSSENVGPVPFFPTEAATPTVTCGNSRRARPITSRCPNVTGSKVPGTTTRSILESLMGVPHPQ